MSLPDRSSGSPDSPARTASRVLLGSALLLAGVSHLTWARTEFLAQVPSWMPLDADSVVVVSGMVEVLLGASLLLLARHRVLLGWLTAGFFVAIFPGNIGQFVERVDGFGLDSDASRAVRLAFQPVLIVWALWATGAWAAWRRSRHTT